jgi:hypothetical protein
VCLFVCFCVFFFLVQFRFITARVLFHVRYYEVRACIYAYMVRIYVDVNVCVCTSIYMSVCVYLCIFIHVCMYVCMPIDTRPIVILFNRFADFINLCERMYDSMRV